MFKVGDYVICVQDYYDYFYSGHYYKVTFVDDQSYSVRTDYGSVLNFRNGLNYFRLTTLLEKELAEL